MAPSRTSARTVKGHQPRPLLPDGDCKLHAPRPEWVWMTTPPTTKPLIKKSRTGHVTTAACGLGVAARACEAGQAALLSGSRQRPCKLGVPCLPVTLKTLRRQSASALGQVPSCYVSPRGRMSANLRTHAPRGLTAHAEHHADGGLPDSVPGHTLVAACVRGPDVVDGQEPLGADMKLPAFRHLNPILEQSRTEMILRIRSRSRRCLSGVGTPPVRTS